jgi:hypothetical protein
MTSSRPRSCRQALTSLAAREAAPADRIFAAPRILHGARAGAPAVEDPTRDRARFERHGPECAELVGRDLARISGSPTAVK